MSEPIAEERRNSFVGAFFALQRELPEIKKESTADAGTRGIMHYANLKTVSDAAWPLLEKYGFIWSCQPTTVNDKPMMRYELTHLSHTEESPQQRTGLYPIFGDNKPQAFGAAITYARRYALCAVLGLTPDNEQDAEGPKSGRVVSRKAPAKATEPADPDQVPGTPLPGEPQDRMTATQQKSIFALLRELEIPDANRFTTVNPILREAGFDEVTSFSQLTIEGGRAIYRGLKKELDLRSTGSGEPA
jgi:ERF superfamily